MSSKYKVSFGVCQGMLEVVGDEGRNAIVAVVAALELAPDGNSLGPNADAITLTTVTKKMSMTTMLLAMSAFLWSPL